MLVFDLIIIALAWTGLLCIEYYIEHLIMDIWKIKYNKWADLGLVMSTLLGMGAIAFHVLKGG